MTTYIKRAIREPLWLVGTLWPITLLAPYLPGPPRPSLGGLAWRQEIVLAFLLTLTLSLLVNRSFSRADYGVINGTGSDTKSLLLTATLFTLWIAASVLWAANPYSAVHFAFQWGAYLTFFVLMREIAGRPRILRGSLYALGAVVWLLSISCLVEWLAGAALTDHQFRLTAKPLFRGFSGFSEVMAVATPIFAALALGQRKLRLAVLSGATALLAWLATLQALERAPILGAAVGLILVGLGITVSRRCHPRSLPRTGLLLAGFVAITLLQIVPLRFLWTEPDPTALQRFQITSITETNTSARLLFWGVGLEMFRARPFLGVGANNYEVAFSDARAQFSTAHRNSPLVGMNEQLLTQYAHNEYMQILAELGSIGFALFLGFYVALVLTFWRALKKARRPLLALGSGAGLLAFAVSSGASAFSFRWLGSGLIFFFAAALASHFASTSAPLQASTAPHFLSFGRIPLRFQLVFVVLMFVGASAQATNSIMHALAQSNHANPARAEQYYRVALGFSPFDAASHYDYGSFLYQQKRLDEAVAHLRYAVAHGINTSTSYAFLAAAEEESGNLARAEETLAQAAKAYPQSVFLLVRHAAALARLGLTEKSEMEFSTALSLDSRAARGWYQLINFDIDAAFAAARQDASIALPGELLPQNGVFLVLKENERRLNISTDTGWRGRMRSVVN